LSSAASKYLHPSTSGTIKKKKSPPAPKHPTLLQAGTGHSLKGMFAPKKSVDHGFIKPPSYAHSKTSLNINNPGKQIKMSQSSLAQNMIKPFI